MSTIIEKLNIINNQLSAIRSSLGMEDRSLEDVAIQVQNNKNGLEEQAHEINNLNNTITEQQATITAQEETIVTLNNRIAALETSNINLIPMTADNINGHRTLYIKNLTNVTHSLARNFSGYFCDFYGEKNYLPFRVGGHTMSDGSMYIENYNGGNFLVNGLECVQNGLMPLFNIKNNPITLVDNEYTQSISGDYIKVELTDDYFISIGLNTDYCSDINVDTIFYIDDNELVFPDREFIKGAAIQDGEQLVAGTRLILPKVEEYRYFWSGLEELAVGAPIVSLDDNNHILSVVNVENMGMFMVEVGPKTDGSTLLIDADNGTMHIEENEYPVYLFDGGMLNNMDPELGDTYITVTQDSTVTFSEIYNNNNYEYDLVYKLVVNEDYQG